MCSSDLEVEELLFRGHPEVVDADLADYFGSIPHAELLKSVARDDKGVHRFAGPEAETIRQGEV